MQTSIVLDSGEKCEVVHTFRSDRLIVLYDGLYVLVDLVLGAWVLSGRPATDAEKSVLNGLISSSGSSVRIIRD